MNRMFTHWLYWRPLAQALFDSAFLVVGAVIALGWASSGLPINQRQVVLFGLIYVAVAMLITALLGINQRINPQTPIGPRTQLLLSVYLPFPIAYLIDVLLFVKFDRELLYLSIMAAVFGVLVSRIGRSSSRDSELAKRRILVFGTGSKAIEVRDALRKADKDAAIVGFFAAPNENDSIIQESRLVAQGGNLLDTAIALEADEIVIALSERRGGSMPMRELLDCRLNGIRVLDLASHFERTLGQIRLDSLYAGWLIFGEGFNQGVVRSVVKRIFDIIASLILLIIGAPVMAVTALLIGLETGFPLLYRQERVGYNGRLFTVIKFRSMRQDAEKHGKPIWATSSDDRVTKVGRIIRKLRIDELPQLYCVLKGDMSLVGPRPERPFFVDQLTREIPFYAVRHSVKPGLTGWAQVCYHYGASAEDAAAKLQYDLYYVKNHSLFLDLVVILETVGVVLTGKGAQ
ncbi:MAG: TIGR03013 family PEP-CTERM/XrtA system glycosyltransferase [Ignavibacteria bacterium]|nr:TIGR03013 family PEP-CTERM/XrtA system glycosyltransferase [Ignavibacteria bacterium]